VAVPVNGTVIAIQSDDLLNTGAGTINGEFDVQGVIKTAN
jgi:hypothetical protein